MSNSERLANWMSISVRRANGVLNSEISLFLATFDDHHGSLLNVPLTLYSASKFSVVQAVFFLNPSTHAPSLSAQITTFFLHFMVHPLQFFFMEIA